MIRKKIDVNPFNSIGSILMMVFVFIALYWVATSVFKLLTVVAPFLLIAALIINHNVVINYGKWLWSLLMKNPLMGIAGIALSFFGFPIIAGFLLGKALLYRKVNKMKKDVENQKYGEFTEFEEVEDEPEIRLELPTFEKPKPKPKAKDNTDYDQYFD